MKKILTILLTLVCVFALFACADDDGAPEGMKLAYGSDEEGYYFYVPEEWIVSNIGDINAAYISRVNTTSVSFTEVKLEGEQNSEEYFFGSYFKDNLPDFDKAHNFKMISEHEKYKLGTAENAAEHVRRYIYSYEYPTYSYPEGIDKPQETYHEFTFMQLLVMNEGRYYIFTYSALSQPAEDGLTSNYDAYLEKLKTVIDNFKFVKRKDATVEDKKYPTDEDGYKLISDSGKSGFDFYVPADFMPDYSDAAVSASHPDGSNVNMSEATSTGTSAENYWIMRKQELSAFVSELTTIRENELTRLGNNSSFIYGDWAYAYEYTYVFSGEKYHVYQIIAINGSKGYTFTFTAKEENYAAHIDSVMKIIEKVNF